MKQDLDSVFHKLVERYYTSIDRNCNRRIKKARDKEFLRNEIKKELDFSCEMITADKKKQELAEVFEMYYKRGESIDWIVNFIKERFGKVDYSVTISKKDEATGKTIQISPSEKDHELAKLAKNERFLLKFFVQYYVYKTYRERFSILPSTKNDEPTVKQKAVYNIKWTGKKDNKNEFVQMIYGLHEAGLLNNGKGEITKIVEALAEVFDVKLSDNWQSNHSKSIHKANRDYEPAIFDQIKEAYKTYFVNTMEGKRKKNKKLFL